MGTMWLSNSSRSCPNRGSTGRYPSPTAREREERKGWCVCEKRAAGRLFYSSSRAESERSALAARHVCVCVPQGVAPYLGRLWIHQEKLQQAVRDEDAVDTSVDDKERVYTTLGVNKGDLNEGDNRSENEGALWKGGNAGKEWGEQREQQQQQQ